MTQTDSLSRKIADDLWKQASVWDLDVPEDRMELGRVIASELAEREQKIEELMNAAQIALEHGCSCANNADPEWHSLRCHIPRLRAALSGLGVSDGD